MIHGPTQRRAVLYETTFVRREVGRIEFNGAWYAASLAGASCKYIISLSSGAFRITEEADCIVS